MSLAEELAREEAELAAAGRLRRLPAVPAPGDPALLDFVSNDYLGLARSPELAAAARAALERFGAGGRAARLLGGGCALEARLEREVAQWLGTEAALFFPSGYQANLGVVTALAGRGDVIVSDELAHASLVDGARLSRARILVHRHADVEHLAARLGEPAARAARRRLVLTESVFSMDGDLAPLAEIGRVCSAAGALLVVDEAHAIGLLGPEREPAPSRRSGARCPRSRRGSSRAARRSARAARSSRRARSSSPRSSTARARSCTRRRSSPAVVAAFLAGSARVRATSERASARSRPRAAWRARWVSPSPRRRSCPSSSATRPARWPRPRPRVRPGFDARAVRPPTVPAGTSRLRLACHADHADAEIDALAAVLAPFVRKRAALARGAPARRRPALFVCRHRHGRRQDRGRGALPARGALRRARALLEAGADRVRGRHGRRAAPLARRARLRAPAAHELALPASPHEAAAAAGARIEVASSSTAAWPSWPSRARARSSSSPAGSCVPLEGEQTQIDWLARAAPEIVLVARSGLGTLNHTLLSLEALRARALEPRALFLVGEPHASNRAALARLGRVERIFELPFCDPLDTAALDRWLEQNDLAGWLGEGA